MATSTADGKTLRRDARRNREQLVASAAELFAASGLDVPVEEVTRHAGVGMGTLYRHFPAKEDLIDAVLEDAFSGLLDAAKEAAESEDAWAGLTSFLERALAEHVGNRGLKDIIAMRAHGRERTEALRARLRPVLRRLIERAQEQGSLRADFAPEDLPLVFWTADRVIEATAAVSPDFWRRYLALLLDCLRAEAATPLPQPPLTRAQLARVTKRRA
ncbi:MAG: TetR/AcrR family transcriptional regulator [Gaiellaceae bacterium]